MQFEKTRMGSMKLFSVLFSVSALMLAANAMADAQVPADVHQGLQADYDANTDIINAFQTAELSISTQTGMNVMVARGISFLREVGENTLADQFESEWNNQFSDYLIIQHFNGFELGDHDPLSPWLANFYVTLWDKTGGMIRAVQLIQDINTLNYAMGVVLRPNGKWRTASVDADRIEYRKHFIPMADIITYWSTLELCKYYVKTKSLGSMGNLCGDGATELEKLMGQHVAPDASDWVFAETTHTPYAHPTPPTLAANQFASEQDFENSILN
jgi:hypothetical protein